MSEILDRLRSSVVQFAFSILVFGAVVFNCTLTAHPRLWANYNKIVMTLTRELMHDYPDMTVLSNNCLVAYVMDVSPAGGKHYAMFNKESLKQHPECIVFWDPFSSNTIFFQTEITKEMMLQDTSVTVLKKCNYWSAEYLLLYKHQGVH
jgi:hypothetical protein